jgi:5-methyltetrahydrofolate--homocysteine methyltransferase
MDILKAIAENVRNGNAGKVTELVKKALDEKIHWGVVLEKGLSAGMEVVGHLFKDEEIFLPEVLMAAKAMDAGQKVLEPLMLDAGGGRKLGTVVLGTVKGDMHNLGKNLVNIMLRGAGFEVVDLGVDVASDIFVERAISEKAQVVGMSALLTTTMPHMRTVIEGLHKAGLKDRVKTIVGGACVTQQFADKIGADAYADNAGGAVTRIKELLGLK